MSLGFVDLQTLTRQLISANIPIEGISLSNGTISGIYSSGATPAQITAGNAIIASYPVIPTYRRKYLSILTDLGTLAANDPTNYAKVVRWTVARVLQNDPILTGALNSQLGLSIGVTTTDPNQAE